MVLHRYVHAQIAIDLDTLSTSQQEEEVCCDDHERPVPDIAKAEEPILTQPQKHQDPAPARDKPSCWKRQQQGTQRRPLKEEQEIHRQLHSSRRLRWYAGTC